MNLQVKRIDKSLPLPAYQTAGAVGFDLYARETMTVQPQEIALIPANIIVAVPEGHMLILVSRSSTPQKKGLLKPHAIGIIDQDYCGETDELKVQVYNFRNEATTVERGERIAQAVIVKIDKPELVEVEEMKSVNRGGFGSTGTT